MMCVDQAAQWGACSGVGDCPEDYELNYLGVTLTPRLFAESFFVGQSLKVFFQFMAMNTLCRLCLVYLATAFHGQHVAPCQRGPINPFSSHCSFTIAQALLGAHTCKGFLLYTVTSVTCWHGVDVSERLCWLWAGWAGRQGNALKVWTSVGNSRCRAVTWGWGEDLITENSSWQSCPKHFVPEYWAVTLVISPYIPFSCKPFISPLPPFFFFYYLPPLSCRKLGLFDSLVAFVSH